MLTLLWKNDLCSCFRKQQISGQEVQAPSSSRKKPDKCSQSCNCADSSVFWLTVNLLFFFCCSCFNREESIKFIVMGNSWHFIIRMKWLLLFFPWPFVFCYYKSSAPVFFHASLHLPKKVSKKQTSSLNIIIWAVLTHYQYFISKYHSYRQYMIIVTPVAETQNFMESDFHLCHSN